MASELKVDKFTGVTTAGSILVTGEGNSTTTNLQQGLNKSWVSQCDQAGAAIDGDSFNISGYTDVATGKSGVAITSAHSDALYNCMASGQVTYGSAAVATDSSNYQLHCQNSAESFSDKTVHGTSLGDLA
tara:strand:- start:42 stop:431 length:390 start_codon:yes stop_codon:yes gene_type:complete